MSDKIVEDFIGQLVNVNYSNEVVAKQMIADFLSEGKQIQIVIAIDDFDFETDNDEKNRDDFLEFRLHNKANDEDLVNVYRLMTKYDSYKDGTAYILVDNTNSLAGKFLETSVFEEDYRHLYCEYIYLINAVNSNSQVKLAINDNQIQLQKS